jgi:hypothetical protein
MAKNETTKVSSLNRGEVLRVFKERLETQLVTALDTFNADKVAQEITRSMRATQQDLVFKVLGVRSGYGDRFEVDHCNGREPIITQFLQAQCANEIRQVMLDITKEEMANLRSTANAKFKAAVVEELNRSWNNALQDQAKALAISLVKDCADEAKKEILGETNANH